MSKKIKPIEFLSLGKTVEANGKNKNDDDVFVGDNFVAVIDGVSHKSSIKTEDGKDINIAQIIIEAIRKADENQFKSGNCQFKPTMEEFVKYINQYIAFFLKKSGLEDQIGTTEATGVIYSRVANQIWMIGDCRAIYDGVLVENPLLIDALYIDVRRKIIEELLKNGWTEEALLKNDVSRDIIKDPTVLRQIIHDEETCKEIEIYRATKMKEALLRLWFF